MARPPFSRILIANRGEIAVRIMQTLQQMGIKTIAIFAAADRGAVHVRSADEAWPLEGDTVATTYLDQRQILDIARRAGAEAIHPGYGFLSENPGFAEACAAAGITFIGPSPEVIRRMGDKIASKALMVDAGVPVVPGFEVDAAPDLAKIGEQAARIGYPVMVKAAAGGGGKGMRLVHTADGLEEALAAASREATSAFGDGRVFVEKYIDRPRHVEMQIMGDAHGHAMHLYERECSIQRRHQKVVEESPSPALDPALREKMGAAAVAACKAMGYTNAGTVEFILGQDGAFYFLEVNTRLQVEHPVTEAITRLDLVRTQVLVAAGHPLPFADAPPAALGHAIECRVYAEDPGRGFLPSTGTLSVYQPPTAPWLRIDSGVAEGSEVTIYHDPMLAKVISWGSTRDEAIARMRWALRRFAVLGVTTNIAFLETLLGHEAFAAGALHTHFLMEHPIEVASTHREAPPAAWLAAALALQGDLGTRVPAAGPREPLHPNPWRDAGSWRM